MVSTRGEGSEHTAPDNTQNIGTEFHEGYCEAKMIDQDQKQGQGHQEGR